MFATSCFVLSSINQYSFMYGNYGTIKWPLMLGNSNALSEAMVYEFYPIVQVQFSLQIGDVKGHYSQNS